jgi:hypothetical protein
MTREILPRPHRKPGSIVNGVDRNYRIRIGIRYPGWSPRPRRRVDNGIVE